VHQGGGWSNDATFCGAAIRGDNSAVLLSDGLGFRLALSPE